MKSGLDAIQKLVTDLATVDRNHKLPGTDQPETVAEHCFSVAFLCWYLFDQLRPNLDQAKIFRYCLAHDALERDLEADISTYAAAAERERKEALEIEALKKLKQDFSRFDALPDCVEAYEAQSDEEARFVRTVDKLQAVLYGWQDDWRPYKEQAVPYQNFHDKGEAVLAAAPKCLKAVVQELNQQSRAAYYDQPSDN